MKKILGIMLSIVAFLVVSMICLGHTLADTDAVILFLKGEVGVKAVGTDEWVDAYKGMELSSGVVVHVTVKNINTSGDIWIGPPGVNSGTGYLLEIGEDQPIDVDNLNKVYVHPELSGDFVSYLGEVE